jgi:hypothetical protein
MKKILLLILISCLVVTGCSIQIGGGEKEQGDNKEVVITITGEDLNNFIDDYYSLYCDLRLLSNEFWIKYYGDNMSKIIQKTGSDIPVMNMLGEEYLNSMKIRDIAHRIDGINNSKLKSHFSESVRLLSLASDFLQEYFSGTKTLANFDEFMTVVSHKLTAFGGTIVEIQPALVSDYESFMKEYPNAYTPESLIVQIVEDSCSEAVWNKIAEENLIDRDYSLSKLK